MMQKWPKVSGVVISFAESAACLQASVAVWHSVMSISLTGYPPDVAACLQGSQYAEAIELCAAQGVNSSAIQEEVRAVVGRAIEALDENPQASINSFITTIGVIEPSIVLCRFFQPNQTRYLSQYLIELHKRGYANADHTRLLFTLFHLREERIHLSQFIEYLREAKSQEQMLRDKVEASSSGFSFFGKKGKKKGSANAILRFLDNFKASTAVDTLIENDMEKEAFEISKIMAVSRQIVSLLITSQNNFVDAAKLISERVVEESGRDLLMEFGPLLLSKDPGTAKTIEATAVALWLLEGEHDDLAFLRLFWVRPKSAKQFLHKAIRNKATPLFVAAFLELLIPGSRGRYFHSADTADEMLALEMLADLDVPIDDIDPLLLICNEAGFTDGIITLLKRKQRHSEVAAFYVSLLENPLPEGVDRDAYIADIVKRTKQFVDWIDTDPELSGDDWTMIL
jgi:rubrerythrin